MKESYELYWKDYYKILQVHPLAEPEVIKVSYIKLAQMYHPDHNIDLKSENKMVDLNEAFGIIGNPIKRESYDIQYNQPHLSCEQKNSLNNDVEKRSNNEINIRNKILSIYEEQLNDSKRSGGCFWNKYIKEQWADRVNEIIDWLNIRSKPSHMGKCLFCKRETVIFNADSTLGQCIDPNCGYVIAPELRSVHKIRW
jgi:DnaJ-class molecular chaperone